MDFIIPDVPDPIVAWRCFNLLGVGLRDDQLDAYGNVRLLSLNAAAEWKSDQTPVAARCTLPNRSRCKTAPCSVEKSNGHVGHGCGIYGLKEVVSLANEFGPPYVATNHCRVWGEVELWGNVYDYELGYRAEFGRLRNLMVVNGYGLTAKELSTLLPTVPVGTITDRAALDVVDGYVPPATAVMNRAMTDLTASLMNAYGVSLASFTFGSFSAPASSTTTALHKLSASLAPPPAPKRGWFKRKKK